MTPKAIAALCAAALVGLVLPARSHHSNVAFDMSKVVPITGVVEDFRWMNPHTKLILAVKDEDGREVMWQLEGRAPGIYRRAGWASDSLMPGETITVNMALARDGSNNGLIFGVTKSDGTVLAQSPPTERGE